MTTPVKDMFVRVLPDGPADVIVDISDHRGETVIIQNMSIVALIFFAAVRDGF